jgi:phosphoesterase RecJ-like protein
MIGLLTDSGNFSHDDVKEDTLLLAAKLMKAGADIHHLNEMLFKRQPKARAMLYARTMSGMRFYHDNRFAVIVVSKENMDACGADNGMTEGFVDFPLNVDSVEVAAALMEVKKGQWKISLRSKTYADVNKIAGVYGGGGHVRASGCMLFGDVEEIIDKLSYTVSQYLE